MFIQGEQSSEADSLMKHLSKKSFGAILTGTTLTF